MPKKIAPWNEGIFNKKNIETRQPKIIKKNFLGPKLKTAFIFFSSVEGWARILDLVKWLNGQIVKNPAQHAHRVVLHSFGH